MSPEEETGAEATTALLLAELVFSAIAMGPEPQKSVILNNLDALLLALEENVGKPTLSDRRKSQLAAAITRLNGLYRRTKKAQGPRG